MRIHIQIGQFIVSVNLALPVAVLVLLAGLIVGCYSVVLLSGFPRGDWSGLAGLATAITDANRIECSTSSLDRTPTPYSTFVIALLTQRAEDHATPTCGTPIGATTLP